MSNTIWTKVKMFQKQGEKPYLRGVFKQLNEEVASGNLIKGIVMENDRIGFVLSKKATYKADENFVNVSNEKAKVQKSDSYPEIAELEALAKRIDIKDDEGNEFIVVPVLGARSVMHRFDRLFDKVFRRKDMSEEEAFEAKAKFLSKAFLVGFTQSLIEVSGKVGALNEEGLKKLEDLWENDGMQEKTGQTFQQMVADNGLGEVFRNAMKESKGNNNEKKVKQSSVNFAGFQALMVDPHTGETVDLSKMSDEELLANDEIPEEVVNSIRSLRETLNKKEKKAKIDKGILDSLKKRLGLD